MITNVIMRGTYTTSSMTCIYETCRPNLEKYKKGAIYRGILEWNSLEVKIRNIESFDEFKSSQKKIILEKTLNIVQ